LIVVAILGILVVVALLIINPAEGQKKARDTKRMKDLGSLQTIITQYLEDGNTPPAGNCLIDAAGCSTAGTIDKTQPCDSNWLGVDVCDYAQSVPLDPANNAVRSCVNGGTQQSPTFNDTCSMVYKVKIEGGKYEVNVRQESKAGSSNVLSDGGNSSQWAETGITDCP